MTKDSSPDPGVAGRLLITCEHASNRVPERYRGLFTDRKPLLAGHRGHDIGAAGLARAMARLLGAPLHLGEVTRLLVDLNRSERHPSVFSEFSRKLPPVERDALLGRYYRPYRSAAQARLRSWAAEGFRVFHLSVHSFTPVLEGRERNCDIGLLYDPRRPGEKTLAIRWQRRLADAGLRVRRNYPYTGVQDGFIPWLRKRFSTDRYLGLELEVNQRLLKGRHFPGALRDHLVRSLLGALRAAKA